MNTINNLTKFESKIYVMYNGFIDAMDSLVL